MSLSFGPVKYIDNDPNNIEWDFQEIGGLAFESEVQTLIRHHLKKSFPAGRPLGTAKSRDGGKDAIVQFNSAIELFGHRLVVPKNKINAILYIECKKIDKNTLSPNDFGGSLMQINNDGIVPDYFMLVTNGSLSPATLHVASQEFMVRGCQFLLVDRYRLARALQGLALRDVPPPPPLAAPSPIVASYIVQHDDGTSIRFDDDSDDFTYQPKKFNIIFSLQNYTDAERVVRVCLHSDLDWELGHTVSNETDNREGLVFYIPPNGYETVKLALVQKGLDAREGLRIGLDIDGRPRAVQINAHQVVFEFDPPLFGTGHRTCAQALTDALCGDDPIRLVSLHGRAGVGKSKILKEVRNRVAGRNVLICSIDIRATHEGRCLAKLVRMFYSLLEIRDPVAKEITPEEFISKLRQLPPVWERYVAIIEDLHHASPSLIETLRTFFRGEGGFLTIVATGRDDDTFRNDPYFSFIDWVSATAKDEKSRNALLDCRVTPWIDEDCEHFIRLTIDAVPESVVKRIKDLSENTPFGCIQAIEYLLDLSIVRVVNRNTVGIINAETIGAKLDLPKGLQELIDLRVDNLVFCSSPRARILLGALAFLGMEVSLRLVEALATDEIDQTALSIAKERRLLQVFGNSVRFEHENMQVYFLRQLEASGWGRDSAKALLSCPAALGELDQYRVGHLHFLSGNHAEAFTRLAPLWEQIKGINNISSTDVQAANLPFLRPLMISATRIGKAPLEIAHLWSVEAYVTLHNAPLAVALNTCERQISELKSLGLDAGIENEYALELAQLKAHMLLNMGHVQAAQKMMQEIAVLAMVDSRVRKHHKTLFDVYDRLQNIFHQINHKELFIRYSDLSGKVADELGDDKLKALVKSSRVKEHYYDDPHLHRHLTEMATETARRTATPRHVCHAEVNLCIAELLVTGHDEERILRQVRFLSEQLRIATENAYSFSVTRCEAALSAAHCMLGLENARNRAMARDYAEIGMESCLRFGNGFFVWQLHNLLALIEMSEPGKERKRVAGHFQTAISYLDRQGLLFLGNLDSCSPNLAVISNWICFLYEYHGDRDTLAFINRLSYYDRGRGDPTAQAIELLNSVHRNLLIGRSDPLKMPVREAATGYLIAIR